jgi:hypothetical protein
MPLKPKLRRLARAPVFSGIAILTLALGIGANTAIFSVIQGILLKPLPYPRSDELVAIEHAAPGINMPSAGAAPFLYFTYREQGRTFQDVGLWNTGTVSVTGLAEPEEVPTLFVTDGVLPMLGPAGAGTAASKTDAAAGGPETVSPPGLAIEIRRRAIGHRPHADARQQAARDRRRPDTFRFLDRLSLVSHTSSIAPRPSSGSSASTPSRGWKPGTTYEQANADVARMIPISFTLFRRSPG